MTIESQCEARRLPPVPKWRAALRALRKWIAWQCGSFYRLYIYRHHMRLIHPRWHWWTRVHPIDGPRMDWCQWCGERRTYWEPTKVHSSLLLQKQPPAPSGAKQ